MKIWDINFFLKVHLFLWKVPLELEKTY